MPRKIRELKAMLKKAGFLFRTGKGSHSNWFHPRIEGLTVTLSGKDGEDAKPYLEKQVQARIKEAEEKS